MCSSRFTPPLYKPSGVGRTRLPLNGRARDLDFFSGGRAAGAVAGAAGASAMARRAAPRCGAQHPAQQKSSSAMSTTTKPMAAMMIRMAAILNRSSCRRGRLQLQRRFTIAFHQSCQLCCVRAPRESQLTRSHLSLPPPRSGWRPGQVDHLGAAARSWMSTCTRIARGRDRRRDRPIVREHFGLANCATSARCESGGTAAGELRATSTAVSNMMGCCRCQRATAELAATAGRAC